MSILSMYWINLDRLCNIYKQTATHINATMLSMWKIPLLQYNVANSFATLLHKQMCSKGKLWGLLTCTRIMFSLFKYVFSFSITCWSEEVLMIRPTMYFLMPSHWFLGKTFHLVLMTPSKICRA